MLVPDSTPLSFLQSCAEVGAEGEAGGGGTKAQKVGLGQVEVELVVEVDGEAGRREEVVVVGRTVYEDEGGEEAGGRNVALTPG